MSEIEYYLKALSEVERFMEENSEAFEALAILERLEKIEEQLDRIEDAVGEQQIVTVRDITVPATKPWDDYPKWDETKPLEVTCCGAD